jgi:hypothetical protein
MHDARAASGPWTMVASLQTEGKFKWQKFERGKLAQPVKIGVRNAESVCWHHSTVLSALRVFVHDTAPSCHQTFCSEGSRIRQQFSFSVSKTFEPCKMFWCLWDSAPEQTRTR